MSTMQKERVYDILVINDKTGRETLLGLHPMTHKECTTIIGKMIEHPYTRKLPYEVKENK